MFSIWNTRSIIKDVVYVVSIHSKIQVKILKATKRLADETDHIVECAKACASNSTEWDSSEQVEWDKIGALRSASANIKNSFGRNVDNQWQLILDSKTEVHVVPIYANRYGMVHLDSDDDLIAKHLLWWFLD